MPSAPKHLLGQAGMTMCDRCLITHERFPFLGAIFHSMCHRTRVVTPKLNNLTTNHAFPKRVRSRGQGKRVTRFCLSSHSLPLPTEASEPCRSVTSLYKMADDLSALFKPSNQYIFLRISAKRPGLIWNGAVL